MQRAEVVVFMRPGEAAATMLFLSQFKTEAVTQEVVDRAAGIHARWSASHRIDVNDALLAATVAITGGKIYTLNIKQYPMTDIGIEAGW